MTKLEECRQQIDEIDSQIIALFEKRMDVVKEVSLYKLENNIPILDASREALMLEKNLKKIKNETYKVYYEDVLKGYLSASKNMQKDLIEEHK